MRELNGLSLVPTAIQDDGFDSYRPGVSVYDGENVLSTFVIRYPEDLEMSEDQAHQAAEAILKEVSVVGEAGRTITLYDDRLWVTRI